MSQSALRIHIRQLCCLGFPGQQLIPPLLKSLRQLVGADSAAFFWVDLVGEMTELYAERVLPADSMRLYFERYYDAHGTSFRAALADRIRTRAEITSITATPEQERTGFYNDIYRPLGAHHVMYGVVREQARALGQLSFYRPKSARPFTSREHGELGNVIRYVAHGLAASAKPAREGHDFVDSDDEAVILVDARGRIGTMSAIGRRLLLQATEGGIRRSDALSNEEHAGTMLRDLVERLRSYQADDARPPCLAFHNAWGRFALRAYFTGDTHDGDRAIFAIRIVRQEPLLLRFVTALGALHLSAQQRQVAVGLADGLSNPELARRMGITINTVASHVKQLFERLDIHDRAAVVESVLAKR